MPWVSGAVGSSGCLMEGWALGAGDVGSDVGLYKYVRIMLSSCTYVHGNIIEDTTAEILNHVRYRFLDGRHAVTPTTYIGHLQHLIVPL